MATFQALLAISILCFAVADNSQQIVPGPSITSSRQPTNESTTVSTTTPPSTSTSATTSKSTSATTSTSTSATTSTSTSATTSTSTTTTTPQPPTTTKSSSTSTTSTTSKPTTSTVPTTTTSPTTVKPTPTPVDPQKGQWVLNYTNSDNTCLVLEAAIQIDVPYKDGNTTKAYKINVPPTAVSNGTCDPTVETITLFFNQNDMVSFSYTKTNDSKYDLDSIIVIIHVLVPGKNGSQEIILNHDKHEFTTPLTNSYKCAKQQSLNLTAVQPDTYVGQLLISHFQTQAFRNATNTNFDEALDCASSETPDVVPIAVGCVLAASVIIVLVAYLIGRRRSQARGYLSM